MKSLEELIEEIRREARGETDAPPEGEAPFQPGIEPPIEPLDDETEALEPEIEQPESPYAALREPDIGDADVDLRFHVDLTEPRVDPELGLPAVRDFLDEDEPNEDLARFLEQTMAPQVPAAPIPTPTPPAVPRRAPPPRRRRLPGARGFFVLVLVAAVAAGAVMGARLLRGRGEPSVQPVTAPALGDQDVVSWAVWDPSQDVAFVTVLTGGGELDPIALGIPPYTYVNVPGYGDATVGDAAALHDVGLLAASVENLIGVRVDALERSSFADLASLVDRLGGIEVDGELMDGSEVVSYLTTGDDDPVAMELRFLGWQSVTAGLLGASAGRGEDVAEILPPEIAAVVSAAGTGGAEVLELPVTDIGSGLSRPDPEAVAALVAERFVPTRTTDGDVRLAILNGAGVPGIGERVSRVLLPEGFRLVVSGNAPAFDVRETRVIAESEDFLQEAELAQRLLGVGRVYLGEQPTGLVDVTVIVGRDFAGSDG